MIGFLAFIIVALLVVLAIYFGMKDDAPTSQRASCLSDGLAFARHHADQTGDTEAVQAIDNGTYKELLERRAAKRQQAIPQDYTSYQYNIAGINFRRGIADYVGRSTGYLKPQPTNRHDPNAIAIYASDGHHLGYIPAYETDKVRSLSLRFPILVLVDIEECYDYDESRRFFVGSVTFLVKNKTSVTNRSKSSVTND